MSTFRFALISAGVFALTFVGSLWVAKDFPLTATRGDLPKPQPAAAQVALTQTQSPPVEEKPSIPPQPVAAHAAIEAAVQAPSFEESTKKGNRKNWEAFKATPSDSDPKREALRIAALQAANAFAVLPCDAAMKKALVEALSAYARAWTEMAGCKSGTCGGDHGRIDAAAATFSTPSDMRVREAVYAAFETGGISRDDFPDSIRLWVTMLTGDPGDPVSACATGRRADSRR